MTKDEAKERAKLMLAWVNGAEVQYFSHSSEKWCDVSMPNFNPGDIYRIKPKKTLKLLDYSDDLCGKVVIAKSDGEKCLITGQRTESVVLFCVTSYADLYNNYVFADGSPCAKEVSN